MKRLPTKVIFQPVLQQNGSVEVQLQCFWNSQKPVPFLDQSVARHVGLDLSNMRTPSSISLMMAALDSLKRLLRVSSQWNGMPGFSSSRNGSMRSAIANAYETWFTSPNQERMSFVFVGVGKFQMASRYLLQGCTLSGVISKPVKFHSVRPEDELVGV